MKFANDAERFSAVYGVMLKPPPAVDLNEWAEREVIVGSESPYPGRYNSRRFPFFRGILEALGPDHPARVITLLGSAQVGKTFIAQIYVGAYLDLDPGNILYVHPTEANAIRFARTKWRPMIRSTPRLGELFDLKQTKEGGNSTLYQERRDGRGSLLIGGASSEASLSMISVKRQVQDDLSKWETNTAGDPEAQADSRSKAFFDAKILKLGTGLLKTNCRITRAFMAGTQHYFHVPCPHCGHAHPLDPDNFIAHIPVGHPEEAAFSCPECGGVIEEKHRAAMVAAAAEGGEGLGWVAHNPGATDISFTIWAAYAPLESWERIARGYLAAQGDPATEQTWWNDTGARAYELPGDAPDWASLKERGDEGGRVRGIVPRGALLLTMAFDCQDDYIDGVLIGWGPNLRRWVVDTIRVEGHISTPEAQAELDELVEREWPVEAGAPRRADLSGIDGNAWTAEVFSWVRRWPKSRVMMLRGVGGDQAPALAIVRKERQRDGKLVKYQGRFFNVGVDGLKGGLYKFLRVTEPAARGYVDFPAHLEADYYEQLTAEKRTAVIDRKGFTVYQWVKPRSQRNEALDTMVYSEALAGRLAWRVMGPEGWSRLAATREAEAQKAIPDELALLPEADDEALPVMRAPPPPSPARRQYA